ncbi:MAG TPA: YihY/virulence factor BrkB family protein [Gammaproteobacteria bacterium]|nr:YihY/virulence factor BrkB family protein [Gammaproteobacteria bacterium]
MIKLYTSRILALYQHIKNCVHVAQKNNIVVYASALAFNTLISLIPLIAISIVILYQTPWAQAWAKETLSYALSLFSFGDKEALHYMQQFSNAMTKMSPTYLFFWLITNILLFSQIQYVLNHIFNCPKQRSLIKATLFSTLLVFIIPFLLLTGFLMKYLLSILFHYNNTFSLYLIERLSLFSLNCLLCSIIFKVFPNKKILLTSALKGGLITATLLAISKDIFIYYIVAFPTYTDIYGRFASIPIMMIWISIMWLIILFGATIVAEFESNRER